MNVALNPNSSSYKSDRNTSSPAFKAKFTPETYDLLIAEIKKYGYKGSERYPVRKIYEGCYTNPALVYPTPESFAKAVIDSFEILTSNIEGTISLFPKIIFKTEKKMIVTDKTISESDIADIIDKKSNVRHTIDHLLSKFADLESWNQNYRPLKEITGSKFSNLYNKVEKMNDWEFSNICSNLGVKNQKSDSQKELSEFIKENQSDDKPKVGKIIDSFKSIGKPVYNKEFFDNLDKLLVEYSSRNDVIKSRAQVSLLKIREKLEKKDPSCSHELCIEILRRMEEIDFMEIKVYERLGEISKNKAVELPSKIEKLLGHYADFENKTSKLEAYSELIKIIIKLEKKDSDRTRAFKKEIQRRMDEIDSKAIK